MCRQRDLRHWCRNICMKLKSKARTVKARTKHIVSFYSMCPMPFCFCLCDQTHPLWINIHIVFQQARGMEKSWIRSNILYCTCWILLFLPWVSWDTQLLKRISAGVCIRERVTVCVCMYAILIKCKQGENKYPNWSQRETENQFCERK